MTLDNLIGISLEKITPHPDAINRLLHAAERNIVDSKIDLVSAENRFDAAYKAIMQLANAALQANGYRTLTSKPGHHQTMIQLLPQTLGTDKKTVIILDAMRKQRNIADYSGDIIPESAVVTCIAQAEALLNDFKKRLKINELPNKL
jgi:uncharacterized protein (UPF0332 family)